MDDGNADVVGDIIVSDWHRPEVVDYTLMSRQLDLKKFSIDEQKLEKELMQPANVEASVQHELARAL